MKIAVAGTGYVGLVTGVCLADKGHSVTCVDVDASKIEQMRAGRSPIYEPGLEELMRKNAARLAFTTDHEAAYADAEVIFIGVGTPEKKDGSANLKYVYDVARQIAASVKRECVVVVKSTVPIGTNDKVEKFLHEHTSGVRVHVASNPEFLAQGTAVRDTLTPSRIVLGVEDAFSEKALRAVYAEFDAPVLAMNRRSAEMVKYASNDFLALKISYINEIANLCESVGADIEDVTAGMGFDSRIGNKFLQAGIGYGGSCFPKDTKALSWLANFNDTEIKTVRAAIEVNENQKLKLLKKAKKYFPEGFSGLKVALLGLTFKPGTDDLREAPSLVNVAILLEDGAQVFAWDPVGVPNYKRLYPEEITYCDTIEQTLAGADVCFIFTEWEDVKALPPKTFKQLMNTPIVVDGRNCFALPACEEAGITYLSVGRRAVEPTA